MYISTLLLPFSIIVSLAIAQTTSTSSSSGTTSVCAAQPVLEACLASTQAILAGCSSSDYSCLCDKYGPVITCFDQCPNDPRYTALHNNQQTYCADASVYASSTTSTSAASSVSTTSAAASTTDIGAVKVSSSATSRTTASATATATDNAGVKGAQIAGGLMMAVAGFAGAIL